LLSCPTRLGVWQCVDGIAMHPGDVARTLNRAPSTISHHLALLESAGLVRQTRHGRYRWYSATGIRWGVVSEDEIAAFAQ
ncbi:MAG TPA: helix-turn-helix domain-containing protein, partial [Polyangiales bacterium]|nr:helix-turn-helix domain-containing protein [Polyangiales bacterium]